MRNAARAMPAAIGPYSVLRQLGAGGFGEVFLARAADGSLVCVKRAYEHRAKDPRAATMLTAESRLASRLVHENIVRVIDAGQDDGSLPYVVSEYVEGRDLAALLRTLPDYRLTAGQVAYVMTSIARALAHAHRAAVIHRDVKPSNVLVATDGRVALTDFGVARVQSGGPHAPTYTAHAVGSEPYMAPELLAQDTLLRIDHRVDLWSLGVLAWEALCGFRPFEDAALGARPDISAGQWAQLNVQADPPRRRSLHDVVPEAPPPIRALIEDLLQPVDRRIGTAEEVIARLEAAQLAGPEHQATLADLVARDTEPRGSGVRPTSGHNLEETGAMQSDEQAIGEERTDAAVVRPFSGAPGTQVGPYTIVRELGTGGMGSTYVAHRADVEKRVCLKVIRSEYAADPTYRQMFLDEARTAAKASHANLVSLVDFGQHESGALWIAFELVDGTDLKGLLASSPDGAIPSEHVALIASDVARGLLHLHTADHRRPAIIHRDVSMTNVMVSYDGEAKVIDFGVAKMTAGEKTETGIKGKLGYMAPEMLRGDAIGASVDQWALGVLLYRLLTGRFPYKQAYDGTAPPAPAAPGRRGPLDPRWSSILGRLLQPDPAHRYPSLAAMLDELAPLIPGPGARLALGRGLRRKRPPPSALGFAPPEDASEDDPPAAPVARRDIGAMKPGERFGEWVIEGKLGTGGMAVVYKASRSRTVGGAQRAALKLIRPEHVASEDFVKRFESEVEIAMALNHQNVVTVLDAGAVDGLYFMAMEFVDGCDLDTLVRALTTRGVLSERRLPPELVLFVGAGLLHGLEYAHEKGVVHRDVSPHNVMVTVAGEVKLNDFGVAKSMRADGMASKTAHAVGKPHYMPPEQFRGDPLDGRADLFAAGVSLYEMLVGTSPYAMRGTPNETFHMVVKRVFENDRPHTGEVAPHAPAELVDVIEALLQPNRDHRPRSAEDVLTRLEPLVQLRCKRMLGELVRAAKSEPAIPISASVLEAVRIPLLPPMPHAPKGGGTLELPAPAEPSVSSTGAPARPAAASPRYLFVAFGALAMIAVAAVAFGAVMLWPDSPGRDRTDPTAPVPVVAAPDQPEGPAAQPASVEDDEAPLAHPASPLGPSEQTAPVEERVAEAPGELPTSGSTAPDLVEPQVAEPARTDQSTRPQRHRPPELRPVAQPTTLSPTTTTSPVNRPRESQPGRGAFGL
jgi:serine/threonine protein kinase